MDNRIIDILIAIRDMYGDGIFYNHTKTKNLLHDLSPQLQKERIQIANFLEMNGYFQLKYAGRSYLIVRSRLIQHYANTYAVSETVATWVVDVFGSLLGYNTIKSGVRYDKNTNPPHLSESAVLSEPTPDIEPGVSVSLTPKKEPVRTKKPLSPVITVRELSHSQSYAARISADYHTAAVSRSGLVFAAGPNDDGQCNVSAWRDIAAVSAGMFFTVGLRRDGAVVATGRNDYGQCNIKNWTEIKAISAGARHTVGLREDGTVVATGQNKNGECNVYNWRNIIHVVAGYQCTFGIKKDLRVLVKGNNKEGDLKVTHLNGVLDIAHAAPNRALALLNNGTLARIGDKDYMHRDFSKWRNIKQLSAAPDYFAGLKTDGTVRIPAYFWEASGIECSAHDWRDIVAVAAGRFHLLGLKKDGTLIAAMMHPDHSLNKGQCNVSSWTL